MTKADVLLGLQWGDEGKGKIVDVLTPNALPARIRSAVLAKALPV